MKLYIISGLGGDEKILEKLYFNPGITQIHIPWLLPFQDEDFYDYVKRMSESIDDSEEFYLLGYSFGGILAQEIHKLKPAKKIVIIGSIRCDKEKSKLLKAGEKTNVLKYLPIRIFKNDSKIFYVFFRKLFGFQNPRLSQYFRVTDPYYLKWSMDKISQWKFEKIPDVIQILAENDIVFPVKNSEPDFIIKNATHFFPVTKSKEVSEILNTIFI